MKQFRFIITMRNGDREVFNWCDSSKYTIATIKEQIKIFEKAGYNFIIEYR